VTSFSPSQHHKLVFPRRGLARYFMRVDLPDAGSP
jgi:hypothetical protein